VDVLADAEKAMDAALNSRTNLISSWRTFLAASFVTSKEYTEQFQQQEAKCQEDQVRLEDLFAPGLFQHNWQQLMEKKHVFKGEAKYGKL
jgi:hypothetical protein